MDLLEQEASIVLLGSLNPAIFHPEWLSNRELISPKDHKAAIVKVVHPEITQFELPWARIEVQQHRFIARTNDPAYFSMLRDLVIGIFTYLEHTPLEALGINSLFQYRTKNTENWHSVGNTLVPKDIWKNYLTGHIGMTKVSINSERADGLSGGVNISISPIMDRQDNGVVFDINNHINIENSEQAISVLNDHWEGLQKEAVTNSRGILEEAGAV